MKYINQIKKVVSESFCQDGQFHVHEVDSVTNFIAPNFLIKEIFVGWGYSMMAAINKQTMELESHQIVYCRYLKKLTDNQKVLVALNMDGDIPA